MYRVEQIEKPLGELPSLLHPLAVIQTYNHDPGQRNPGHAAQGVEEINPDRKPSHAALVIQQAEQQRGNPKGCGCFLF